MTPSLPSGPHYACASRQTGVAAEDDRARVRMAGGSRAGQGYRAVKAEWHNGRKTAGWANYLGMTSWMSRTEKGQVYVRFSESWRCYSDSDHDPGIPTDSDSRSRSLNGSRSRNRSVARGRGRGSTATTPKLWFTGQFSRYRQRSQELLQTSVKHIQSTVS